jgi:hypothetical protein
MDGGWETILHFCKCSFEKFSKPIDFKIFCKFGRFSQRNFLAIQAQPPRQAFKAFVKTANCVP